jgi:hypothetical protein
MKNKIKNIFKKTFSILKRSIKTILITGMTIYIIGSLPFEVRETKLSNPDTGQTIAFQETVHYAESDFFQIINKRKAKYLRDDYLHFYEQVNFTTEDMKKFESKLGYAKNVSKLFTKVGLKSEMVYITKNKNKSINADIDSKELLSQIKSNATYNNELLNSRIDEEVLKIDSNLEKHLIKTVMKASLKLNILLQKFDIYMISDDFKDSVIDYRNEVLVKKIINTDSNIYVTYGALHAKGVIELLKENGFIEQSSVKFISIK